jgi:hypothetical protein
MNFKSKLSFSKSIATIVGLVCIAVSCFVFQGCEKEETNSTNTMDITKSVEFEEYIAANIELVSAFQRAKVILKDKNVSSPVRIGVSPEGITYRTFPFKINQNLLKNVTTKSKVFLKKYPFYKNYNKLNKKEMIITAITSSKKLNDRLYSKGIDINTKQLVRLKSGGMEDGLCGIYNYSDYINALSDAMCYSDTYLDECSGYVFSDGTAVLFINFNATHSSSSYPGPVVNYCIDGADVSVYNGNVIESTYHTHFNSERFSGTDYNTQSNYFPNSTLIILYNDNIYEYNYEYGYFIP